MKRILALAVFLAASGARAQFTPPANLGYCYYAAGAAWIPIAASGSGVSFTPPSIALYGMNGSTPSVVSCDANGNLSAGSINGTLLAGLASGLLYNTTGTGVPSIATADLIIQPLLCADSSGSGTAQICNTVGTFVPDANDCILYTTTTANTGAGLTLNVNSGGPISVAKWQGATTLAANDVLANQPVIACLNGAETAWDLNTIGNAPGGSAPAFSAITGATNTTAAMVVGTGASLAASGSGTIAATTATNLAGTFTAHQFYGNSTGSTAAPAASLIGVADVNPGAYAVATGLVNVLAVTLSPAPTALYAGMVVNFMPNLNNTTGTPTLNVNGLGAKQIVKFAFSTLASSDLNTAAIATVIYDGSTYWELQNPKFITGTGTTVLSISPALTGTPLAPTATAGTSTTQIATTAFVTALGLSIPTGTPTYTAGTSVTSVVCATSYTCTNTRGEVTIVGGTATTGTIATINFSATLGAAPGLCMVTQNGGTSLFDLGHGVPGTSSFTITAGVTVAAATLNADYSCIL